MRTKAEALKQDVRPLYEMMLDTPEWAERERLLNRWFEETDKEEIAKIDRRVSEINESGVLDDIQAKRKELQDKYGMDATVRKILSGPYAEDAEIWEQLPDTFKDKYDAYYRLAGEVEARNASARQNMSEEKRRNIAPSKSEDVAREEQVVTDYDSEGGAQFSIVNDPVLLEQLENEETVTMYRSMAMIDGKLYPPMSSMLEGKLRNPVEIGQWEMAEERPDLAYEKNGKWYFDLTKDNGKDVKAVAYNPYIHLGSGMLNDQFAEAQSRPNLVTVAIEVPVSELNGAYKAEKAHDATGLKSNWKAGPITGRLTGTRGVYLSRYGKITGIVPNSEVAKNIAETIGDRFKVLPTNVFPPAIREELEKLGYEFVETTNKGEIVAGHGEGNTWAQVYGGTKKKKNKKGSAQSETSKASQGERGGAISDYSSARRLPQESSEHLSHYSLASQKDVAKLQQNTQNAINSARKKLNAGGFVDIKSPEDAVRVISKTLKLSKSASSQSYYGELYEGLFDVEGETLKLRVSTHLTTNDRMGNAPYDDKISIVIRKDGKHIDRSPHNGYKEYVYEPTEISLDEAANAIIEGAMELLQDGGDFVDKTGLAHFTEYPYKDAQGNLQYSIPNRNQEIFVSNAARAVEGIKQEKATPEQWLAMIQKQGGLKAGEDKWLGLSEWLKGMDKKSVTKQEILDFINENMIRIEEVHYGENSSGGYEKLDEEILDLWREAAGNGYEKAEQVQNVLNDRYDGFADAAEIWYDGSLRVKDEGALAEILGEDNPIDSTRLDYTTEGLENKQEIALTVPTIEPWNTSDEIHFGDAGGGRAVAWIRFGETTDAEGKRVLVIDEIQSKRHQEGREKGYIATKEDKKSYHDYERFLEDKYGKDEWVKAASDAEMDEYERLERIAFGSKLEEGVPSAPFDKNWQELAMKRMLRYAAENGFDKVAWTTGEQQAERYDMRNVIENLQVQKFSDGYSVTAYTGGYRVKHGSYPDVNAVAEVYGKEVAQKIVESADSNKTPNAVTISGDGLKIGGEGMKAFYDKMLPSFVNKYVKKWGAKVGEVTLPELEESAQHMWSVDVTPEMKESVMQGQVMFSISPEVRTEMDAIVAEAKKNGTYLKAPNGEPTKLNPEQWAMVRTKNFKRWFGDWEKAARVEKLRTSTDAIVTGAEIDITGDEKQNKKNALEYGKTLQGWYINKDTGAEIQLQRGRRNGGVNEVLQHNYKDIPHLQSIAAIPQIIENGILIAEEENRDRGKNPTVASYQHYVCGLMIGDVPYTVHSIVAVDKNGDRYYDHNLTRIEKRKLLDIVGHQADSEIGFGTTPDTKSTTNSVRKDKELFALLLTNASKIVDENGEPMVVYHGGSFGVNDFVPMEDMHVGTKMAAMQRILDEEWGYESYKIYKNEDSSYAWSYQDEYSEENDKHSEGSFATKEDAMENAVSMMTNRTVTPVFLNIKNVKREADANSDWKDVIVVAKEDGFDGIIYENEFEDKGHDSYVAFSPTQIKSATENNGEFNGENGDIRYSMPVYHGSGAKFDKFDHAFMGSGEGAQVFGWGTYVSEVEGIAKTYADSSSSNIFKSGFGDFYLRQIRDGKKNGKNFEEVKQELLEYHKRIFEKTRGNRELYGDFIADYEKLQSLQEKDLPARNLYTVEIPDDNGDNYLHWDKQVPPAIAERILDAYTDITIGFVDEIRESLKSDAYANKVSDEQLAREYADTELGISENTKGEGAYKALVRLLGSQEMASKFLHNEVGLVGISYPAEATTGGRADGAKNYVIFNENDAQIVDHRRFSLPARIAQLNKAEAFIRKNLRANRRGKVFGIDIPVWVEKEIRKALGRDYESHNITINGVVHGLNNHGVNGKKLTPTSIPITEENTTLIPYIMVAPDKVQRGSMDSSGRESIQFIKNLSNGVVVVVEKEYKNSPDDMETINIWADLSSEAINAQQNAAPGTNVQNAILDIDIAKIRKDAEEAIRKDVEYLQKEQNVTPTGQNKVNYSIDWERNRGYTQRANGSRILWR